MSKSNIEHRKMSPMGKKSSHTGNKPLTQSLYDDNVMVTQKMRKVQESNSPKKVVKND
tara:strand:- start:505 stop:678 length:174 start_codon:yes stop_codon:yes gene_type:complete